MKRKKIINFTLTFLVSILFIASAFAKLTANPETLKMAAVFGINPITFKVLGIVELISVILFIYPRTGILGTLLLVAYMGGAIATHLEHQESILTTVVISAFVWLVAIIRFPELKQRLLNK